ncbi:MAG: Rap1a/Tai family immunity protein [Deltaproteobacteria bacterium]|nr:Rap1a/Tai family immunity protein [Deltaproteobacteria bacterium]
MNKSNLSILYKKRRKGIIKFCLLFFFLSPSFSFADGASLLKTCEDYLAFEYKGDTSKLSVEDHIKANYCPAYIEATIELNYLYQASFGKDALFCLPEKKPEKEATIKMVINSLKALPEKDLEQDATFHLLSIFSGKYPCIR